MNLEKDLGIPTVPIVTEVFEVLAKTNAASRGMPYQRTTYVPHPVWGKSAEQLRHNIEGVSPVTSKPVMLEIIDGLTRPLSKDESQTGFMKVSSQPTMIGPDSEENLTQYFHDDGMTDHLPIVLPTKELVSAMLKGTSHKPDEIVGKMSPAADAYEPWSYTVEQVAVNAVMAGAKPEYFPVILALAASGISSMHSSTNSFVQALVINGPIIDEIGLNSGIGAMGPFSHANATIGRAYTLLSKNLGHGQIPGETYLGALGNAMTYANIIIAENEKENPWAPLHVDKGLKASESAVSFFMGYGLSSGQGTVAGATKNDPKFDDEFRELFGTVGTLFGAFVVLDPTVAKNIHEHGYDSKQKLIDYVYASADGSPPHFRSPEAINFVVTGGQTNLYYHYGSMRYMRTVSIDEWR